MYIGARADEKEYDQQEGLKFEDAEHGLVRVLSSALSMVDCFASGNSCAL